MKYINKVFALSAVSCLLLVGCGGGSSDTDTTDSGSSNNAVLTGVFVDSAVEGLSFSTETQDGITNSEGEFTYLEGEAVTFSVGDTVLFSVTAKSVITPVDLAVGSSNENDTAINIARFIQSLDSDSDPDNGIVIPSNAALVSAPINFDMSIDDFESNSDVINMIANSGSNTTSLLNVDDAVQHINNSTGSSLSTEVTSDESNSGGSNSVTIAPFSSRLFLITPPEMLSRTFNVNGILVNLNIVNDTGNLRIDGDNVVATDGTCIAPTITTSSDLTFQGFKTRDGEPVENVDLSIDVNSFEINEFTIRQTNYDNGSFNSTFSNGALCIDSAGSDATFLVSTVLTENSNGDVLNLLESCLLCG